MTRISKYVGNVKEVGNYTFTVIEVEKQRFTVEINKPGTDFTEIEVVSRGAWVRGVFSKIMKRFELNDLVGTVKESYGWLFKIVEATKEFVSIVCEGFEGEEIISMNRWKKGRFGKTIMGKNTGFRRILSKCRALVPVQVWFTLKTDFTDELEQDIYNMEHIDNVKELKRFWSRISKKYHPDLGGNTKDFQAIREAYQNHKTDLELIEETMKEFGYGHLFN